MKLAVTFAALATLLAASPARAQYAVEVTSYTPGAAPSAGYTNTAAALGGPQRDTAFGAVTTFNPPFSTDDLVSIGEGGELTLRLSNYVLPQVGGPEIGVFTNTGIADIDWPNGQAAAVLANDGIATFGIDSAVVEVSADGASWVSLGEVLFDLPTAGYTDPAATSPANFQQPFTGVLADFASLDLAGMQTLLGGSGGGYWLDISSTGLSQVGYVRFSLADDGDALTDLNFDLDALSIAAGAVGPATVPEPAAVLLLLTPLALTTRRHVQPRRA
ncbi:hypothetical protein Pla123a_06040 [Posidoniimonas polymericola]|uniref:PEP-CTERM protein-sorting domain-containing protein n=1 Tax=Posidoniimonas polymericola TaxID=2528002 RepID=A0A5C5ZFJ4_9BACT|nr:hypothetical protein [Posidoniimonas polymericola]TWT85797.1 hypothetical protein Pla123a_06040 [Posidoniimonas polymericola]